MKWSLPDGLGRWKEVLKRYQTVLLVLAVGVVLMLLPTGEQSQPAPTAAQITGETEGFDLEGFEQRLSTALSEIEGAGETKVVLTLKSGSRKVLAQNLERNGEQTVTTAVTLGKGSSQQETVTLQTLGPQFQGALVVCPGGENPDVRLKLVEAVSALTGLGSDHISICKGA